MLKLAVCVALVGCGSSKDEPKPDKPTVETPAPSKPETPAVRPPTPAPPANAALGQCTFTLSGAATGTVTPPGNIGGITLSYWTVDPKMREAMYKDKQGFIITCGNGESGLSFSANKLTADELPFGPKKYELKKGVSLSNIHVIGSTPDGAIVGAEGTLEITAMDFEHVAGTFAFASKLMKKNAGGLKPIEVKGSFDYKCPSTCK